MSELIFEVRDAEEGGFNARGLGKAIFTQGETWDELEANVLEAVDVYCGDAVQLEAVKLRFVGAA